jgi:putative serine protease PepD
VPIVSDASAWWGGARRVDQPGTAGESGTVDQSSLHAASGTRDAWWSDALSDPWRDPTSPAVVYAPASPPAAPEPMEQPPGPPRRGLGMIVLICALVAILAGALGGSLGYVFALRGGVARGAQLGGATPPELANRAPTSLAGVVKRVLPSVVTIKVRLAGGGSLGSGFVISPDGYVLTNDHVIAGGGNQITATFTDGNAVSARVVGSEAESDIAVLKIDKTGLTPVEFGDSDAVQVGDPVLAIGAPLALSNTVTYGIVSALNRPLVAGESGQAPRYYAAIQTDAAVNQGNSGGPLVDAAGRVIGINSVIKSLAANEETAGNVGLAFAIPINQAKRQAQDIIDLGKARRTVIGAQLDPSYRDPSGGVRLSTVEPDGPAAGAGLRAGDVVLRIGGDPVEEPNDLIALIRKYAPGSVVSVDYIRSGARLAAQVTLAADAK